MRVSILFLFFISFCRRFFTCFVFTVCSFIPLCLVCELTVHCMSSDFCVSLCSATRNTPSRQSKHPQSPLNHMQTFTYAHSRNWNIHSLTHNHTSYTREYISHILLQLFLFSAVTLLLGDVCCVAFECVCVYSLKASAERAKNLLAACKLVGFAAGGEFILHFTYDTHSHIIYHYIGRRLCGNGEKKNHLPLLTHKFKWLNDERIPHTQITYTIYIYVFCLPA